MTHASSFIATIVAGLTFAYIGGLAARLLRLPNIAGYIIAGVFLGPHTPGLVADQKLTAELAEVGVALLMFKIGLHFSVRDLLVVWHVVVPGALLQIVASTAIGCGVGLALGWSTGAAIVLGLAIAISSTAVATKALEASQRLATEAGRIALGWLVVQDLVVILALVLLPIAAHQAPGSALGLALITLKTLAIFAAVTGALLGVGRWLLPAILALTARIGSQELFTLGVIVIALGVAFGLSHFFGMSLALGAFFAGLVLGESDLSHQAAAESLPIQNIFTVLFFVSVGMLFDPLLFIDAYWEILLLFGVIAVGCGLVFFGLMLVFGSTARDAGAAAGALAQIGEFSFVLASLAGNIGLMDSHQQGVLLAAAIVSMLLHPLTMMTYATLGNYLDRVVRMPKRRRRSRRTQGDARRLAGLGNHVIIVGYGRVGSIVACALKRGGQEHAIIEGQWRRSTEARERGNIVVFGDATRPQVLKAARPAHARLIVVALPDAFQSRRVIELARLANPDIVIVARVHSDEEYQYLTELGVGLVIMGEREVALSMSDFTLQRGGLDATAAQAVVDTLRIEASTCCQRKRKSHK